MGLYLLPRITSGHALPPCFALSLPNFNPLFHHCDIQGMGSQGPHLQSASEGSPRPL